MRYRSISLDRSSWSISVEQPVVNGPVRGTLLLNDDPWRAFKATAKDGIVKLSVGSSRAAVRFNLLSQETAYLTAEEALGELLRAMGYDFVGFGFDAVTARAIIEASGGREVPVRDVPLGSSNKAHKNSG